MNRRSKPERTGRGLAHASRRFAGVALCLGLLASTIVSDAEARIAIREEIGLGQNYAAGAWSPLFLILENFPDSNKPNEKLKDFRGRVVVKIKDLDGFVTQYARLLELPTQSRKRVEFSVQLPDGAVLTVDLIDAKGGLVVRRDLFSSSRGGVTGELRSEAFLTPVVILVTNPNDPVTFPMRLGPPAVSVKAIAPDDLPSDYRSYESAKLVVLRHRVTGQLRAGQLAALRQWLELGGRIAIILPKAQREIEADPWLSEILPGRLGESAAVRLSDLDSSMPNESNEPILLARWEEVDPSAEILWECPAGPVALLGMHEAGRVYALGIDPSALSTSALQTGAGRRLQALLETMIFSPDREDIRARHYWSTANIEPFFENVMILPNLWVVTALIVLFVAVVGPINFAYLRRKKRLELAWFTIPGLSVFFFVAVYGYGAVSKGGDQHYASAEIVHVRSGSSKGLMLWSAIQFSPQSETYTIETPNGGVTQPLGLFYYNPLDASSMFQLQVFRHGPNPGVGTGGGAKDAAMLFSSPDGATTLLTPVEQWRLAFYNGERPVDLNGSIEGYVTLGPEGRSTLVLDNRTDAFLDDVTCYVGARQYNLDPIEANSRIEIELTQPGAGGTKKRRAQPKMSRFEESAMKSIKSGSINSYPVLPVQSPQRRVRLVARQELWTSGVKLEPEPDFTKTFGLIELDMPLDIQGRVKLRTQDYLRLQVYSADETSAFFFYNQTGNYCDLQDASVEVILSPPWTTRPVRFVEGTFELGYSIHTERLILEVFNYRDGLWDEVFEKSYISSGPQGSRNDSFGIKSEWVNPITPMVRVRMTAAPLSGGRSSPKPSNLLGSSGFGVSINRFMATMIVEPANAASNSSDETPASLEETLAGAEAPPLEALITLD